MKQGNMKMNDNDFIDYMRQNLVYDLAQEGRTETAKDILKLCKIAEKFQDKLTLTNHLIKGGVFK